MKLTITILFAFSFLCCAANMQAQWEVQDAFDLGTGSIRSIGEVQCGGRPYIIAGTTDGLYLNLDPTGKVYQGKWIDISKGLPIGHTEISTILTKDSIVFVSMTNDLVYYTYFSQQSIPSCRPLAWKLFGNNLQVTHTYKIILQDTTMFAGTDNGVWRCTVKIDSTHLLAKISTSNSWSKIDNSFNKIVFSLYLRNKTLFAGTSLNGVFYYEFSCTDSLKNCAWYQSTPMPDFQNYSIFDIKSVKFDSTNIVYQQKDTIPCKGIVIATGTGNNLYLAPVSVADSVPMAVDYWINISPNQYSPNLNWKINTLLIRDFPNSPHSIFVGTQYGGIYLSQDCGQTWQEVNNDATGKPVLRGSDVRTLTLVRDSLIIAGVQNAGLARGFAQASAGQLRRGTLNGVKNKILTDTVPPPVRLNVMGDVNSDSRIARIFDLVENQTQVVITVYNLLGIRVKDFPKDNIDVVPGPYKDLTFSTVNLPNGLYICVVQGSNGFRLAEKFIVSRP